MAILGLEYRRTVAIGGATRLWKGYGLSSPSQLVLEDLAFARGLVVVDGPLDSADARLIRGGKRGLVRLSDRLANTGRRRFALAHEIGHWELHKAISQLGACTDAEMRQDYRGSDHEVEANWFAAELLMPAHLFASCIKGTVPDGSIIKSLAAQFDVSFTAAAVRYVELSNGYCVFVLSERGRIKWWRCSRSLDGPFWLRSGIAVPPRSLAGKYFAGEPVVDESQTIGMVEWTDQFPDYAEEALEAMIPLGNSGAVVTMLWLE
jgi:hypothetical protein